MSVAVVAGRRQDLSWTLGVADGSSTTGGGGRAAGLELGGCSGAAWRSRFVK